MVLCASNQYNDQRVRCNKRAVHIVWAAMQVGCHSSRETQAQGRRCAGQEGAGGTGTGAGDGTRDRLNDDVGDVGGDAAGAGNAEGLLAVG